ncbi:MAG: hypothetical protein IPP68_07585 [Elusimicrobia bacterium]|nr:hypothetical protein [Elusimicrobiota bacterium]
MRLKINSFPNFLLKTLTFPLLFLAVPGRTAEEPRTLLTERSLHPGDILTGEVLHAGEWVYGQPPFFAPGWFRWGVTERCTLQFDAMAWLGGLPDANVRFGLGSLAEGRVAISWETMVLYFDATHDNLKDLADEDKHLFVRRAGGGGYSRLNVDVPLPSRWIGHVSLGASYSHKLAIRNEDRSVFHGRVFRSLWDPAVTLGLEKRASPKWAFHAGIGYGETFTFQENRPRKFQATYGFRFAPWVNHRKAFWRNARLEINAIMVRYNDARETRSIPIPLIPFAYWQW